MSDEVRGFSVKILADSVGPTGKRLTTFLARYPRPIHSEIMTHRMLSKNSASSRAIPTEKLIQMLLDDPFVPEYIGANQKGMQAGEELSEEKRLAAVAAWMEDRDNAIAIARKMLALKVHKQVVNRLLETQMWISVVISATEWDNFFALRAHKDAEPHFQKLARMMRDQMIVSDPRLLKAGDWHLPFISDEDYETATLMAKTMLPDLPGPAWQEAKRNEILCQVSTGRCARVSYLTHEGKRDLQADIDLYAKLAVQEPLHASPAEHVAQAMDFPQWFKIELGMTANLPGKTLQDFSKLRTKWATEGDMKNTRPLEWKLLTLLFAEMQSGNFFGWRQLRKTLPKEHIGGYMP